MRADQRFVVGGSLNGDREVSEPLPAVTAIQRFHALRAAGYGLLTMTDADTGEDCNVGQFIPDDLGNTSV